MFELFELEKQVEIMRNGKKECLNIIYNFRDISKMLVSLKHYKGESETLYALSLFYQILPMDLATKYTNNLQEMTFAMDYFLTRGESVANPRQGKSDGSSTNWETDMKYISDAILKTFNVYLPNEKDMHWWTFLSYFSEIGGDNTFSYITRIRNKRNKNKKLGKDEREFVSKNRHLFTTELWG